MVYNEVMPIKRREGRAREAGTAGGGWGSRPHDGSLMRRTPTLSPFVIPSLCFFPISCPTFSSMSCWQVGTTGVIYSTDGSRLIIPSKTKAPDTPERDPRAQGTEINNGAPPPLNLTPFAFRESTTSAFPPRKMCNNICKCILISAVIFILLVIGLFIFVGFGDTTYLKQHAFLVAGSKGYENYRHQADVLQVYQALINGGFPEENIILMMYDDIAHHKKNPTPGIITSYPGGPNLYENVSVDYSGKDVSPLNFLNILLGQSKAMKGIGSGRVVESGMFENTFIYFAGHGGPGMIYFPQSALPGDVFIKRISKRNALGKITMFIDASYSGSFLDGLVSEKLEFIGVTSTDTSGQSLAGFYDKKTFLADVFSHNFAQEVASGSLEGASLDDVVERLLEKAPERNVHKYGNLKLGRRAFSELISFGNSSRGHFPHPPPTETVKAFEVEEVVLKHLIVEAQSEEERQVVETERETLLQVHKAIDDAMEAMVERISNEDSYRKEEINNQQYTLNPRNFNCFKELFAIFTGNCYSVLKRPYVAAHLYKLVNMCSVISSGSWLNKLSAIEAMSYSCSGSSSQEADPGVAENLMYTFGLHPFGLLARPL